MVDISQAVIERTGTSEVRIGLPPWDITAHIHHIDGVPTLTTVTIHNPAGINATALSRIPWHRLTAIAADALWGGEEAIYRRMATPIKEAGRQRSAQHYQRVAKVAAWAARSKRPGGPAVCVAQFWGVHERTARRWLAAAARCVGYETAQNPAAASEIPAHD